MHNMTALVAPDVIVGTIEVVGKCDITAYAYHENDRYESQVVALYYSGPQTSVDAVRAKLASGKAVVARLDWARFLKGARASRYMKTRDETLKVDHALILAEPLVNPSPEDAHVYVLTPIDDPRPQSEYTTTMIGRRINDLVDVVVLEDWYSYLRDQGLEDGKIFSIPSKGMSAYAILNSAPYWTGVISEGLRTGRIHFPERS